MEDSHDSPEPTPEQGAELEEAGEAVPAAAASAAEVSDESPAEAPPDPVAERREERLKRLRRLEELLRSPVIAYIMDASLISYSEQAQRQKVTTNAYHGSHTRYALRAGESSEVAPGSSVVPRDLQSPSVPTPPLGDNQPAPQPKGEDAPSPA